MDLADLKKHLRQAGFEIYRTVDAAVLLAERVRDNLILDSGIAVSTGTPNAAEGHAVRITVRAQASHFPGYSGEQVRSEALKMAGAFVECGYAIVSERTTGLEHPSEPGKIIDTTAECVVERASIAPESLEGLVRAAFALPRMSVDD